MVELPLVDRKCDALRQEKQSHHGPNQAARHDAKFIPKSNVFFLPAKPDEPHPLVERAAYFLLVVGHTRSSLAKSSVARITQADRSRALVLGFPSLRPLLLPVRGSSTRGQNP